MKNDEEKSKASVAYPATVVIPKTKDSDPNDPFNTPNLSRNRPKSCMEKNCSKCLALLC